MDELERIPFEHRVVEILTSNLQIVAGIRTLIGQPSKVGGIDIDDGDTFGDRAIDVFQAVAGAAAEHQKGSWSPAYERFVQQPVQDWPLVDRRMAHVTDIVVRRDVEPRVCCHQITPRRSAAVAAIEIVLADSDPCATAPVGRIRPGDGPNRVRARPRRALWEPDRDSDSAD